MGSLRARLSDPLRVILVTYDDGSSVAMLKLDANGNVTAKWSGGPVLDNGTGTPPSISAGDVDDAGQLILGLSDNSIAVVNLMRAWPRKVGSLHLLRRLLPTSNGWPR